MPTEQDRTHALNVVWGVGTFLVGAANTFSDYGKELLEAVTTLNAPVEVPVAEWWPSHPVWEPTDNFWPDRKQTTGIVVHSTRGGAQSGVEFQATINWFKNPGSQASAHLVISQDGRMVQMVNWEDIAWHAEWMNANWLGVELEQPRVGDEITERQYKGLAWFVVAMEKVFGKSLLVVEHKDSNHGAAVGKTDIGPPFSIHTLWTYIDGEQVRHGL